MTATPPPDSLRDRYGREGADARSDRFLRRLGAVLGVLFVLVVGWLGWSYVSGQEVSAEMIKFKVVSDSSVQAQLEVRKEEGTAAVCTLRAQAEDTNEVGRRDVRIDDPASRVDTVVTVRTTARATTVTLVGCRPA
ncbi:DUF4307 domain-containing protein [Streptomyces sp. SCUT-3]|uniref:DUF4307 domain-containing protein n=1 Tax=Streptomyces TaxID=1883 RepID=UPI000CAC6A73|nr:DUF4307 domain-containing protein [Streptomyces sp. SCUT-3]PLW65763.1 DUF4307 domain-containing protein [Streptomyces sp. DJ]QMV21981.1 DUF4307 domain-containing protein [Streptomyces sp. SCUT-3]